MTMTTSDLYSKALELRLCARSWEPGVRLLGNVRADEISAIVSDYVRLRMEAGISDSPAHAEPRETEHWELEEDTADIHWACGGQYIGCALEGSHAEDIRNAHNDACNRLEDRIATLAAEVDELQRRLDAEVKMLEPTPELIANAQMDYQANFELEVTGSFHARAVAIAEGKSND